MRIIFRIAGAALVVAATAIAHAASSRSWTVLTLPNLGEYGGGARGLNNRGDVVGTSGVAQYYPHPVQWSHGTVTDLLAGNPASGVANAINDDGAVVGTENSAVMVWKDGHAMPLAIVGEPQDINKSGAVVGYYYPSGEIAWGPQRGFYWKDGVLHDIGNLGNTVTAAGGVNDRGVVVGYSRLPSSSTDHAVVWEGGVLRDLGALGGSSYAYDVNNHGLILGAADTDGVNHMVTWDARGGPLRDHGAGLAGYALNDRGDIVGSNAAGKPFLLEDGRYTWLLDLPEMRAQGWLVFAPFDINDRGWIAGLGFRAGSTNQGEPVLLIPDRGGGGGGRPKD